MVPMGVLVSEGSVTSQTPVRNKERTKSICLLTSKHPASPREETKRADTSLANSATCVVGFVLVRGVRVLTISLTPGSACFSQVKCPNLPTQACPMVTNGHGVT